jgi:N-acyl homoserine lactone hydrolase
MTQYKIIPLVLSNIEVEKSKMTYLANYGVKMLLPTVAFYLQGGDKNILVDTGSPAQTMLRYEPNQAASDVTSFEEALAGQGLRPKDIDIIIQTHLHHDHIGNTARCPQARVIVQEAELDFALAPHPLFAAVYPLELFKGLHLQTVRGDTEIADGVRVLLTPGHSPGTQSVAVETAKGTAIITGFCCIAETFEVDEETAKFAPGWLVYSPGCHTDALAAFDNALRMKGLADILIPNHEPTLRDVKSIP